MESKIHMAFKDFYLYFALPKAVLRSSIDRFLINGKDVG